MERLTFEGGFCDIAQCRELPCPYNNACSQRKVWERLKAYEDTGLEPEEINDLASVREISPEAEYAINKHADNIMADAEHCKVYGSYVSSVEDVEEAKRALAKQAAQCVERAMLDNDMFLVDGGTVGWKLLLYGGDNKMTTICQSCGAMMDIEDGGDSDVRIAD